MISLNFFKPNAKKLPLSNTRSATIRTATVVQSFDPEEQLSIMYLSLDKKMSRVRENMEKLTQHWVKEDEVEEETIFNRFELLSGILFRLSDLRKKLRPENVKEIAEELENDPDLVAYTN
jgi:hypothetical protein